MPWALLAYKKQQRLTEFGAGAAVNVERQVTLLHLNVVVVEHHAVRTQFLRDGALDTLVVFVALETVGEVPVGLGALVRQLIVFRLGRSLEGRRGLGGALGPGLPLTFCTAT